MYLFFLFPAKSKEFFSFFKKIEKSPSLSENSGGDFLLSLVGKK